MTFREWVEKWQIGPGMNDTNPGVKTFIDELATGQGRLGARFGESAKEQQELIKVARYSGFDGTVGPGWIPILDRLAEDLVKLGWDRDLSQVKEKFGTLRFYINATSEAMEARIDQAEDESAITCEECGAPGKLQGTHWFVTLCQGCWDVREAQRKSNRR